MSKENNTLISNESEEIVRKAISSSFINNLEDYEDTCKSMYHRIAILGQLAVLHDVSSLIGFDKLANTIDKQYNLIDEEADNE